MAEPKPVYRVLVTARDRAAMLALLQRHRLDIGGSPRYAADGAVRIEAYVPVDRIAELEADGASMLRRADARRASDPSVEVGSWKETETAGCADARLATSRHLTKWQAYCD